MTTSSTQINAIMVDKGDAETSTTPFHGSAQDYLKKHKIPQLFEILTASLVYNRPEDPKEFIKEYLKQLVESRESENDRKLPKFFDETNVISIFGMLDIRGKGHITLDQYRQGMDTLGVTEYTSRPNGWVDDKITEETFTREACSGLQLFYQTYSRTT